MNSNQNIAMFANFLDQGRTATKGKQAATNQESAKLKDTPALLSIVVNGSDFVSSSGQVSAPLNKGPDATHLIISNPHPPPLEVQKDKDEHVDRLSLPKQQVATSTEIEIPLQTIPKRNIKDPQGQAAATRKNVKQGQGLGTKFGNNKGKDTSLQGNLKTKSKSWGLPQTSIMKIASWNIRGLNMPLKQNGVRNLIHEHNIDLIGILERNLMNRSFMTF